MAAPSFTTTSVETLTGVFNAGDTFDLNVFANLSAGDAILDYNGDGYSDILNLNVGGVYNFTNFSFVGIDIVNINNPGAVNLTIPEFYAANNYNNSGYTVVTMPGYGPGPAYIDGSAVTSHGLALNLGNAGDTAYGGQNNDQVTGYSGSDSLRGGAGGDCLMGGSGVDTRWGGVGVDTVDGGSGDDVFYVAVGDLSSGDSFNGGGEQDVIQLAGAGTYDLTIAQINGVESLLGSTGDDRVSVDYSQIAPSTSLSVIDLGGGVDRLTIYNYPDGPHNLGSLSVQTPFVEIIELMISGSPTITMSNANAQTYIAGVPSMDSVVGGLAADTVFSGDYIDYLSGGAAGDLLVSGSDGDYLYGNDGADTLYAGWGDDYVYGNSGADILLGGGDNDVISPNSGADTVFGGAGNDFIDDLGADAAGVLILADASGETGDDTAAGNVGADTLFGGLGADSLSGRGGADALVGGDGADTLQGGWGNGDVMWGEAGADIFLFMSGHGADLIADFQPGIDKIQLQAFSFSTFATLQLATTKVDYGNGVAITFSNGDQLTVVGLPTGGLSSSDFIII